MKYDHFLLKSLEGGGRGGKRGEKLCVRVCLGGPVQAAPATRGQEGMMTVNWALMLGLEGCALGSDYRNTRVACQGSCCCWVGAREAPSGIMKLRATGIIKKL